MFLAFCFSTTSSSVLSLSTLDGLIVCANLGGVVLELVEGLDLDCANVGGNNLLNLGLLGSLYLNVVLGEVGPRGLDSFGFNLGNFVIDSSFTSSSCFDLTSMSA